MFDIIWRGLAAYVFPMLNPSQYLTFANQADMQAETTTNTMLRAHYVRMAAKWRDLSHYTEITEACRPGGPNPN
jgi:hypothetical protein